MSTGRRGPAPAPAAVKRMKGNPGKREGGKALADREKAEAEAEAGAGLLDGASSRVSPSDGVGGGGEAQAEVAVPSLTPPDWLNGDGLVVWNQLAPKLATMRILGNFDLHTFGRYCQNFGRWVKLQKRLDEEGETYTSASPHGTYHRTHPAFMVADRLDRACERAEANFALNPADRQRLYAARAAAGAAGGAGAGDLFGHVPQGQAKDAGDGEGASQPTNRPAVGYLKRRQLN